MTVGMTTEWLFEDTCSFYFCENNENRQSVLIRCYRKQFPSRLCWLTVDPKMDERPAWLCKKRVQSFQHMHWFVQLSLNCWIGSIGNSASYRISTFCCISWENYLIIVIYICISKRIIFAWTIAATTMNSTYWMLRYITRSMDMIEIL